MPGIEAADARLGILLLLIVPLFAAESVGYTRGGYNSRFWALPLDEKLDHVAAHPREWLWIGAMWIPMLAVATAGLTAFSLLLAQAGQGTLAGIGMGAFLLGALAWLTGVILQVALVSRAATVRRDTGTTPGWLQPFWSAGLWFEGGFILLSNLAYVAWGVAMVQSGFPAEWAGWASIALASLIVVSVLAARQGFPHLGLFVTAVLGVALVIA